VTDSSAWKQIWANRRADLARGSILPQLMAADGLDTALGAVSEAAWIQWVGRIARHLGMGPGTSVFEVGCGAGAVLYVLRETGCVVSGIDQSVALVDVATEAMPDGHFEVCDAADTARTDKADVVLSCGVFMYFSSLEYAEQVLDRMVGVARHAVAVLDIPDVATQELALAARRAASGGDAAYASRYAGLDHLYFDRSWMRRRLTALGLVDVNIADQDISGYGNGPYRFNAWGFVG
jgi:SAM-dependent methyltransferase